MNRDYEQGFEDGKEKGIKQIRTEMFEEVTRKLVETYRMKGSDDYVKGQYDAFFDLQTHLKTL